MHTKRTQRLGRSTTSSEQPRGPRNAQPATSPAGGGRAWPCTPRLLPSRAPSRTDAFWRHASGGVGLAGCPVRRRAAAIGGIRAVVVDLAGEPCRKGARLFALAGPDRSVAGLPRVGALQARRVTRAVPQVAIEPLRAGLRRVAALAEGPGLRAFLGRPRAVEARRAGLRVLASAARRNHRRAGAIQGIHLGTPLWLSSRMPQPTGVCASVYVSTCSDRCSSLSSSLRSPGVAQPPQRLASGPHRRHCPGRARCFFLSLLSISNQIRSPQPKYAVWTCLRSRISIASITASPGTRSGSPASDVLPSSRSWCMTCSSSCIDACRSSTSTRARSGARFTGSPSISRSTTSASPTSAERT